MPLSVRLFTNGVQLLAKEKDKKSTGGAEKRKKDVTGKVRGIGEQKIPDESIPTRR